MMLAARAIDKPVPLVLPLVTKKMDGLNDAYLNESARIARYKVNDPAKLGTMFPPRPGQQQRRLATDVQEVHRRSLTSPSSTLAVANRRQMAVPLQ